MPPIRDHMTPSPLTVEADDPLEAVRALMTERKIRHLPVMRFGEIAGVLTQNDLHLTLLERRMERGRLRVHDAMTEQLYVVDVATPLDSVMRTLADGQHSCALVIEGGALVGIFTAIDSLRMSARSARRVGTPSRPHPG